MLSFLIKYFVNTPLGTFVSHIESMRDTVDSLLEIKKEKGFSQINFG